MWTYSLKILIVRMASVAVLACSSAVAQEQLSNSSDFFEKHLRLEAKGGKDSPKLDTRLEYAVFDMLNTSSLVKMNNNGFEDHMAVGFAQKLGSVSTRFMYTVHRYNYSDDETQSDDISMDFQYHTLRVQHRVESTMQVSKIALPFELFSAQLDVSVSQTLDKNLPDSINVYQFVTQFNRLKVAAAWKSAGDNILADISTEYRPSERWLMKYAYSDDGVDLQRKIRSEYTGRKYHLAGEFKLLTDTADQNHITSALSIEKNSQLAALKLRLEYDDNYNSPALYFEVKSSDVF